MFKRASALITVGMYFMVGTVAVRYFMPRPQTVTVTSNYLQFFSKTNVTVEAPEEFNVPNIEFAELKIPNEAEIIVKQKAMEEAFKADWDIAQKENVTRTGLPFYEPIVLSAVHFKNELPRDLMALYKEFRFEDKPTHLMVAESLIPVKDSVSTKLAKNVTTLEAEVEPEFFEYVEAPAEVKKEVAGNTIEKKIQSMPTTVKEIQVKESIAEVSSAIAQDFVAPTPTASVASVVSEKENVAVNEESEEISINDLMAFDHSKAKQDVANKTITTVVGIPAPVAKIPETKSANVVAAAAPVNITNTPKKSAHNATVPLSISEPQEEIEVASKPTTKKSKSAPVLPTGYSSQTNIQVTSTDLKNVKTEVGFEIRFRDDESEAIQDYNSGEIVLKEELAQPMMTRAMTILKRGFVPTNTDLMIEDGSTVVSLPVIEEEKFNKLMAPFESRGPIGAVLVELDDETDGAELDIPYSKVIQLDGDLRQTTSGDFRYSLFIGVKAGNALLSYKTFKSQVISKIIHVHEREVTYDSNFFEKVKDEKIKLFEEDLLAREKSALIISSEQVKQFATTKTSNKISDHTHQMDFGQIVRGGRRYVELGHQSEAVFVGFRESTEVTIPSENFMRFILSKIEGSKLGNRCLIQVNLTKKALKVDVGAESVGENLMTYTQILDTDGRFYDSMSEKSHKIIVVGENQGASEISQEAKINFKVTYQDGSVQYLGSYCSPNSYLVEQL